MSKSNPVHLWRFGRTRALFLPQKSLNRAKTGVLNGTPKNFPGPGQGVLMMHKTQLARINWKIKSIFYGLTTRTLYFLKKYDTKWPKFPPYRNWPIWRKKDHQLYSKLPTPQKIRNNWKVTVLFMLLCIIWTILVLLQGIVGCSWHFGQGNWVLWKVRVSK